MNHTVFPVIDLAATGENIRQLRLSRGLSVRDLQSYFGFEEPQAIYKWQRGQSLPSVDNLFALGKLLDVPMDQILVPVSQKLHTHSEQQAGACCSPFLFCARKALFFCFRMFWHGRSGDFEHGKLPMGPPPLLLAPAA